MLKESHELAAGMHAMQVQALSSGESLATTLARLRDDPAVEYAEPDYRRFMHATPNDPLFQAINGTSRTTAARRAPSTR